MRKIEQQMNDAVANNKNWQSANTSVHYCEENGESIVRLHGNKIAVIGDDFLQIFDGGYQSATTKSRLNALIDRFCNAVTDGVFQKDYQWYIRDNKVTQDFSNGYIFAWWLKLTKSGRKFTLSFTLWSCYSLYFRGDKFLPFFVSTVTLNV